MADPLGTLGGVCTQLGLEVAETLRIPSWNGVELEEVYPWGTIRKATPEANHATAMELTADEQAAVRAHTWQYLERFGYSDFL